MMPALSLRLWPRLRVSDWVVNGAMLLTAALLAAALLAWVSGFQPLFERSGSMRPTLSPGDLLISQTVSPAQVRPGDVVSFVDPSRHDELITHRVVSIRARGSVFKFATRGDANPAAESWTIAASGHLRRMVAHVPLLGYAAWLISVKALRLALVYVGSAALALLALRRIWRTK
jgi:signal peptidase